MKVNGSKPHFSITNQLLHQLSYAGILRAETAPSAAIPSSLYTPFFMGCQLAAWRMERRCADINGCCGNYKDGCANKK
jgi:hypothetical protein